MAPKCLTREKKILFFISKHITAVRCDRKNKKDKSAKNQNLLPGDISHEHPVTVFVLIGKHILWPMKEILQLALTQHVPPRYSMGPILTWNYTQTAITGSIPTYFQFHIKNTLNVQFLNNNNNSYYSASAQMGRRHLVHISHWFGGPIRMKDAQCRRIPCHMMTMD